VETVQRQLQRTDLFYTRIHVMAKQKNTVFFLSQLYIPVLNSLTAVTHLLEFTPESIE
jgi:hypothetical protein